MTQFQIPAARSEFTATIPVTRAQRLVVMCDLGFSSEEIGGLYEYVVVDEALVASIAKAGEEFKAEAGRSSSEKAAATRVVNFIKNGFDSEYEARLANFRREVSTARVVVREGFKVSHFELDVNIENRDRISARFVSRRDGWDRPETSSNYAFSEISKNESGEFVCQFVVCESGYGYPRDADPRFATIAEAQARLTFLCEWDLALRIDVMNEHVAKTAAELAQVEMTLDLLAAAGVTHLIAA